MKMKMRMKMTMKSRAALYTSLVMMKRGWRRSVL
jgi:hypothetical protein